MELYADFNTPVKKGQVIAKLDPSTMQAQVDQANANLIKSRADLDRNQVSLDDSSQKLVRAKELSAKGLVTQADLDSATIAVALAKAQISSSQATITQAEATLQQNKLNVEHCIITAPIDGIVTQRSVDVGQTVAASMSAPTLFVIAADLTKLQINASIDESDVGRIRPAQNVTFRVDAYPGDQFLGVVAQVRLQPVVQQNVTTYSTIISVPNPDYKLKLGMTANLKIEIGRRTDAIRLPNAALRFRPTNEMFAALNMPVPDAGGRGGRGGAQNARGGPAGQGGGRASGAPPSGAPPAAAAPRATGAPPAAAAAPAAGGPPAAPPSAAADQSNNAGRRGGNGNSGGGRGNGNFGWGGRGQRRHPGGGSGTGGGAGGGGGRGGGRGGPTSIDQFKTMSADQQKQLVDRMKSRGQDTKEYEAAMKTGPKLEVPAPKYGAAMSAETIDALFPPLPPVERPGTAWIYVDSQLKQVRLRTGITDGNQTELISGDLVAGTELVTGIVLPSAVRNNGLGTGNPLTPGGNRGGGPGGGFGGPGGNRGGGRGGD